MTRKGAWIYVDPSAFALRDHFAGQALTGVIAHGCAWKTKDGTEVESPNQIAELAYEIADAMLAERAK